MTVHSHRKLLDALYIGLLLLYVLAGMVAAPFHGDEATMAHLSKDWYRLVAQRDLSAILYRDQWPEQVLQDDQEYRLENGVVSKYAIGLASMLAGARLDDLNYPWFWGTDWNGNAAHMPKPAVLFAGRLSSTLMTLVSVALVFAIGKRLGGRRIAYPAAFVYATMPGVLINGRRMMFEGANLLAVALLIVMGLEVARRMRRDRRSQRNGWLYLGLAAGFAVASKHNSLLTVVPIFGALLWLGRRDLWRTIRYSLLAGVAALALFLILNPAWWSAPLKMPAEVMRLRLRVTEALLTNGDAYTRVDDRLMGLVRLPLDAAQYYEIKQGWSDWLADSIRRYESAGLQGIDWDSFGLVVYPLLLIGALAMISKARRIPYYGIAAAVLLFTAIALFILNPLPWQRYYLPLAAPVALALGVGVAACWRATTRVTAVKA
ncbi:MAG: glycosyltransferase family 39 protein [Anaerolineae bacterium]|nr:glycosyltransferase family 39 protein [Anaerolineae bacterium]